MRDTTLVLLFVVLILAACAPANTPEPTQVVVIQITSPAFAAEAPIPLDYSCKGNNTSPALSWTEPPAGTKSFALILEDPDAPGTSAWVHWVIFNIPASMRGLDEAVPTDAKLNDGSLQGRTSANTNGYHGPCPPTGTHHYFFKLYALDTILSLSSDANKDAVLAAIKGHVLANAQLMGTFTH